MSTRFLSASTVLALPVRRAPARPARLAVVTLGALIALLAPACSSGGGGGSAIAVTSESPGPNCASGGIRVDVGPDANGDGVPDSIASTQYVCNGTDGMDGLAQLSTVGAEAAGVNCAGGGVRIDNGPDTNGNGTLETTEIASTQYVCSGAAGAATLTTATAEPAGPNCTVGGVRLDVGIDDDASGTLELSEIDTTSYVCDGGTTGAPELVRRYTLNNLATTGVEQLMALDLMISVTGPGRILAIGTVELWCGTSGAVACSTTPRAYFSLSDIPPPDGTAYDAPFSDVILQPGVSENLTRTEIYDVPAAGDYTYYLYVQNADAAGAGRIGVYREQITLVFIPS